MITSLLLPSSITLLLFSMPVTLAAGACSLLTAADIENAMKAKVVKRTPSSTRTETGCTYDVGQQKVILSYFTDLNGGPKAKSMKDDPFMHGISPGPNVKDYGNTGCKITDAGILFSTNCNHYQPRWLHIAVQTHAGIPISIDTVKSLLDKAASRFR